MIGYSHWTVEGWMHILWTYQLHKESLHIPQRMIPGCGKGKWRIQLCIILLPLYLRQAGAQWMHVFSPLRKHGRINHKVEKVLPIEKRGVLGLGDRS